MIVIKFIIEVASWEKNVSIFNYSIMRYSK